MLSTVWEYVVRLRTWLVNLVGAALIVLPELLNAPEVIAVIPQSYQKWVFVAALLLNIWMRPRPASMAQDPETQVRKAIKASDEPVKVTVTGTQSDVTKVATVTAGGKE